MIIGIIGLGFVGSAMFKSFQNKGLKELYGYDKFKNGGEGNFEDCLKTNLLFLALPTKYNFKLGMYDKQSIIETCEKLSKNNYNGVIIIKSTVEPETTNNLSKEFPKLQFIHNPEFLTAKTAYEDFHNQKHIVLGKANSCSEGNLLLVKKFYNEYYPDAEISLCSSIESESMKSFVNCFYSVKIQFFTELYLLCQENTCDYQKVRNMMLKNGWINEMHTNIPGSDGKISYGGLCFPKDTNALKKYMERKETPHKVLDATIKERNDIRDDNNNCD